MGWVGWVSVGMGRAQAVSPVTSFQTEVCLSGIVKLSEVGSVANHISLMRHI